MTYSTTVQLWRRGAQAAGKAGAGFRKLLPAYRQWEVMKSLLNRLVINQRIGPLSLIYAKELQQYAEELVHLGRRAANDPSHRASHLVESMLKSAEAREILYERLVPRYAQLRTQQRHREGPEFATRVVNTWTFRDRDTTPLGFIEFVDRPGEFFPSSNAPQAARWPSHAGKAEAAAEAELLTRRERRQQQRLLLRQKQQ